MEKHIKDALIRAMGEPKLSAIMIGYHDGGGNVRTFTAGMSDEVWAIVHSFNQDMRSTHEKAKA